MLDIVTATSTNVRALTGSSRPGAVPPLVVLEVTTHDREALKAATPHPDAKVIHLAERVAALAPVSLVAAARRAKRADAVDAKLPALSRPPQPENRTKIENQSIEGWYIATFSYPTTLDEGHAAAMKVWNAERAEEKRIEAALHARHRMPQWEALEHRTHRRLIRRAWRLTYMRPQTQDGLKAKAAAAVAVMQTGASDVWATELHASISRDALRIIGAEADARAEAARQADRELLALGRAWEASCARYEAACAAEDAMDDAYELIAPPRTLIARPGDLEATGCRPANDDAGHYFGQPWYGQLDRIRALRDMARRTATSPRRDEILDAYERWTADVAAENERSGLTAARVEHQAAADENTDLRARICRLPARTPAGIDLKLRVILWLHDGLTGLEGEMEPESVVDPQFSASIALSLVIDLARMGRGSVTSAEPARVASAA